MDIPLGAKNPRKEINLGKTGSFIVLGVIVLISLILIYYIAYPLVVKYVIGEDVNTVYVKCNDGTIEEIQEGVFYYCGEYVGADTPQGVREYLENLNNPLSNLNIDTSLIK